MVVVEGIPVVARAGRHHLEAACARPARRPAHDADTPGATGFVRDDELPGGRGPADQVRRGDHHGAAGPGGGVDLNCRDVVRRSRPADGPAGVGSTVPASGGVGRAVNAEGAGSPRAVVAVVGGGGSVPVHGAGVGIGPDAHVGRVRVETDIQRVVAAARSCDVAGRGVPVRDGPVVGGVVGDAVDHVAGENDALGTEVERDVVGKAVVARVVRRVIPLAIRCAATLGRQPTRVAGRGTVGDVECLRVGGEQAAHGIVGADAVDVEGDRLGERCAGGGHARICGAVSVTPGAALTTPRTHGHHDVVQLVGGTAEGDLVPELGRLGCLEAEARQVAGKRAHSGVVDGRRGRRPRRYCCAEKAECGGDQRSADTPNEDAK